MKELVEKALPYLPRYLSDLGSLLVGPKRFIARKKVASHDAFVQSLVFVALSMVLGVGMTMPMYPQKDLWTRMSACAVGYIVSGALFSLALHVAWRAVGGRAPLRSFFVTYAYFYGAASILLAFVVLLFVGTFRTFEPDIYARFVQLINQPLSTRVVSEPWLPPDLSVAAAYRLLGIMSVFLLGHLVLAGWALVAWGAFRELNGLSRWRSLGALAIAGALAVPGYLVTLFVTAAMQ